MLIVYIIFILVLWRVTAICIKKSRELWKDDKQARRIYFVWALFLAILTTVYYGISIIHIK